MSDEAIVITEPNAILAVSRLALRHRLHLETTGIKFTGGPSSNIVRALLKSKTRNRLKLLAEYENWMTDQGFVFKRYTEPVKLTQCQEENNEIQNHIRRTKVYRGGNVSR